MKGSDHNPQLTSREPCGCMYLFAMGCVITSKNKNVGLVFLVFLFGDEIDKSIYPDWGGERRGGSTGTDAVEWHQLEQIG